MRRRARVLVGVFVVVQIVVPAALLNGRWSLEGSRPVTEYYFGWQMFSTVDPGTYTGTAGDGSQRDLSLDGLPVIARAIAYNRDVPQLLCDRHADLMTVSRSGAEDGLADHEKTYEC